MDLSRICKFPVTQNVEKMELILPNPNHLWAAIPEPAVTTS
jgi:hypothetical protein